MTANIGLFGKNHHAAVLGVACFQPEPTGVSREWHSLEQLTNTRLIKSVFTLNYGILVYTCATEILFSRAF
jgi:hypothetical protein